MKLRKTPLASAVALVLAGAALPTQAQQADNKQKEEQLEKITVTGRRASLEQSLNVKREITGVVDVVTADDIGKMPDKNVADAISRIPGVNTSSAAAGEGGFDENDRVSLRGTNPSLTQTLINGHTIGTGDWFILSQFQSVGRSVSFTLLPSELVGQVIVHKSSQADMVEGGVAGVVDVKTRRPLDFKQNFVAEGSAQMVYSDLAKKTDPQLSGLINWKNEAKNVGVLFQAFSETRHIRRDGQEILGYTTISPTSAVAQARPDLANVAVPSLIGSSLFEQERKRVGGAFDIEVRPNENLTLDFNGFYSHLDADNYNRNFMAWPSRLLNDGVIPTSYTVRNGTLVSATFPTQGNSPAAVIDNIYRPGAAAETYYLDFNARWRVNDRFTLSGQVGYAHGLGETPSQPAYEGEIRNAGLVYSMNGTGSPTFVSLPGANTANFAGVTTGWAWNSKIRALDEESYAQADGKLFMDAGALESLKFGVRINEHKRKVEFEEQGGCTSTCWSTVPAWGGGTYPSNFGTHLGGGLLRNLWQLDPAAIQAYVNANVSRGRNRHYWPGEIDVKERNTAAYVMGDFGGHNWNGNAGVRVVNTKLESVVNVSGGPAPLTHSAFGPYTPTKVSHSYTDVLPSANLKFDLSKQLVARIAAARTIARPDYSALGGAVSLNDQLLTGSGGNPDLKPVRSTNLNGSIEWYFAPKSLLSAGVFYMDLSSYVTFGTVAREYYNQLTNRYATYLVTVPKNTKGKSKGIELSYQQPLWNGFGVVANYTYADGKDEAGGPLVGSSKHTYNLEGYFENDSFSARLAYTHRSKYLVGLDRSFAQTMDDTGSLSASVNYKLNDRFTLTFDALNLNNPTLKYYGNNTDQPRAFYSSGRQFYFGIRAKI